MNEQEITRNSSAIEALFIAARRLQAIGVLSDVKPAYDALLHGLGLLTGVPVATLSATIAAHSRNG